jgi:hypothetical protein
VSKHRPGLLLALGLGSLIVASASVIVALFAGQQHIAAAAVLVATASAAAGFLMAWGGVKRPSGVQTSVWAVLGEEVSRQRRNGGPLTLVRLSYLSPDHAQSAIGPIKAELRAEDVVSLDGSDLMVLLIASNREAALNVIDRLTQAAPGVTREVRMASFPEEALTVGALFEVLSGDAAGIPFVEAPAVTSLSSPPAHIDLRVHGHSESHSRATPVPARRRDSSLTRVSHRES